MRKLLLGAVLATPVVFASPLVPRRAATVVGHRTVTPTLTRRRACTGTATTLRRMDTAATTLRRMDTAATIARHTDTGAAATTVPACASMVVRGRMAGVPEWASAEWDGAEGAAGDPPR
jgi:hypothetical protein